MWVLINVGVFMFVFVGVFSCVFTCMYVQLYCITEEVGLGLKYQRRSR